MLHHHVLYCRLPIVQAGTFALLVPTLSYLDLPQWKCPGNIVAAGEYLKHMELLIRNQHIFIRSTRIIVFSCHFDVSDCFS
jgi:hypothetical protein